MNEEVAVVGWAQTKHARSMVAETHQSLCYSVSRGALDSCGMDITDIDTVISAGSDFLDGRGISSCLTVDAMGAQLKEESKVAGDGLLAAIYAYMRITSGLSDAVLVVAYGKSSESSIIEQTRAMAEPFYTRPLGMDSTAAAALQARSYFRRFGIDPVSSARVAVKNRAAGADNPKAQLREKVTLEEVLSSGELVAPIRKLEACPVSDGACAVVLAEGSIARSLGTHVAWITGVGHSVDAYYLGNRKLERAISARRAARAAYDMAGLDDPLEELDIIEASEFYAYQELLLYEALGLCDAGQGAEFLDGLSDEEGSVTINRSGGALCANPLVATGLVRLAEVSAQVSGTAGELQVSRAVKGLAHGGGGFAMQTAAAMVVER